MTIEGSFGILKSRWRILLKRQDNSIENINYVILSCFILHNICMFQNDDVFNEWNDIEEAPRLIDNDKYSIDEEENGESMRDYLLNKMFIN